jgi:group I intron endonuclease
LNPTRKQWHIYKITSPTGRVYIGVTSNYKKRIYAYKCGDCKSQSILYNSIVSHGFINHDIEIIESFIGTTLEALSKEMFWIRTFMSNAIKYRDMNGMNLTDGGQGTIGYRHTEAAKQVLSEKNRQYRHTDEAKKKIGAASAGNKYNVGRKGKSDKWYEAMRLVHTGNKYNSGRTQSKELIEKRFLKLRGRRQPAEHVENRRKAITELQGRPIVQYDNSGKVVAEYESISRAAKSIGASAAMVHMAANGVRKTCKGYSLKYKTEHNVI